MTFDPANNRGEPTKTNPAGCYLWHDEALAMLTGLWGKESVAEIALRMHISTNAVLGKVHRLGLHLVVPVKMSRKHYKKRSPVDLPPPTPTAPYDPSAYRLSPMEMLARKLARDVEKAAKAAAAEAARMAQETADRLEADRVARMALTEPDRCSCQWPVDCGARMRFCGKRVVRYGKPYCAAHMEIAYAPVPHGRTPFVMEPGGFKRWKNQA